MTNQSSTKNLIPTDGGVSEVNGLKIQNTYCIAFDACTLEILAVAPTHDKASEIATGIYNAEKRDARSDEVRFDDDSINAKNIVGRNLSEFQYFVENNPNHPLIKNL